MSALKISLAPENRNKTTVYSVSICVFALYADNFWVINVENIEMMTKKQKNHH